MMLNFVRYLPKYKLIPTVLCKNPSSFNAIDSYNLKFIPKKVKIFSAPSLENIIISLFKKIMHDKKVEFNQNEISHNMKDERFSLLSIFKLLRFVPNRSYLWFPCAFIYSIISIMRDNISIIFSRSGSVTCHTLGYILKIIFKKPWVVSLSDPWTTDPNNFYQKMLIPERLSKWYDLLMERQVIYNADKIVLTTHELKNEYLKRYNMLPENKFVVIPNSYDRVFDKKNIKNMGGNKKFSLNYVGSFMNKRTPEPLFQALNMIKEEDNNLSKNIEVNLLGNIGPFKYLISKYGLSQIVNVLKPIPYHKVFNYLYNSDVLLLIDSPYHYMCLPSKLVEYIFTGKPILAITAKKGSASNVVRLTNTGFVVSPNNIVQIKNIIQKLYYKYVNNELFLTPNWSVINMYSAENCTNYLAKVIMDALINDPELNLSLCM